MKRLEDGGSAVASRTAGGTSADSEAGRESFGKLQFHPLVNAFPRLSHKEIDELAEEIRTRGGCQPILKRGEIVLDDYNRCVACERAGVPLVFKEWDGSGSLAVVVTRAILPRTHLTESQRAAIAVPISDALAEETIPARQAGLNRGESKNQKTAFPAKSPVAAQLQQRVISENCYDPREEKRVGRAAEIAAELCQVSPRYVYEARKLRDADRDLFEMVRKNQITLSAARVKVSKKERAKNLLPVQPGLVRRIKADTEDALMVGDCIEQMRKLVRPLGEMDLIFADPPYNLGWKYDSDPTHDRLPDARYLDWTERWMRACKEVLSPRGSMFVMIDSRWQDRFCGILRNIGLHHRRTIIWADTYPSNCDTNYQPCARFILYFTRSEKHFTFNADALRVKSIRDSIADARRVHAKGIVLHDVWGGGPRGDDCGGRGPDIKRIDGNSPDRVPWEDAPPQVPALILQRIIAGHSNEGDRVFDPFTGNGTTWKEARLLGRKFTGIERSPLYAAQARQWALGKS